MEGFLWLLTQMALLLTAAAAVFLILGWRWRGHDMLKRLRAIEQALERETAETRQLYSQRDSALADAEKVRAAQVRLEADLQEANDHRRNLERELIRVHEEHKTARAEATARISALEAELLAAATVPPSLPADDSASDAAKISSVTKKIPVKAKQPRPVKGTSAREILKHLNADISRQETLLTALRQEYADWQRRMADLQERGSDPASLGLARKSLDRSESQVREAAHTLGSLQRQASALHNALEQAETLHHTDDLTKIKGIKGAINNRLYDYGVRTFRQIAAWSADDVQAFSELLAFKDRAKRDQWVEQARALCERS